MNPKTTLVLAVVLLVVVGVFWLAGGIEPVETLPPETTTKLLESSALVDEEFGEPTKMVCKRRDGTEWTFVRAEADQEPARAEWNITQPLQAEATSWQVSGIVRRIKQLRYEYKIGAEDASAVTPAQAGLEPPLYTVTLENEEGVSVTVEVGREFAERQTYVRLGGSGDIYAVSTSLGNLLKERPIEYRDQRLFDFESKHVKRLEITDHPDDGEAVTYVLVRSDDGWTFETPVKAVAVAEKIDSLADTLSRLSVTGWVEAEAGSLAIYGLGKQAGVTLRATIEEPPPVKEAEEEPTADADAAEEEDDEPAVPEPIVRELALHLSRRSPIGEATKVYVCRGGERVVGTIVKTQADRLMPDLAQWRDMRLTRVDATAADRIELTTPQGEAVFVKRQGKWVDEASGVSADQTAVTELLNQVRDLKAQSLVELTAEDKAAFGLDEPQANIRLNVPGEPQAQRFVVGGFTDAERRRMVYLRHNQGEQVAKVRAADVGKMIRDPAEYRDRTVFDLKPDQLTRVVISRRDDLTDGQFTVALSRVDDRLRITEPVAAKTSDEQVKKLTTALGALQATKVMSDNDRASYGLDDPAATCELTYQPPEITRYVEVQPDEPAEESTGDESEAQEGAAKPALKEEKYQPPAETYKLLVASHQGKTYCLREDRPVIYEVPNRVLNLLRAEYHDRAIFDFEESQVVSVSVERQGDPAHRFTKVDDQWRYAPEPDLPIDPKRVQDLLLRLKDLKTERFVAYGLADPGEYGLDEPRDTVTIGLEGSAEQRLVVSARVCQSDPSKRRYAMLAGSGEVFLISSDTVKRFEIDLEEFETP